MLQPVLQPGQMEGVFSKYQTRTLKRKSRSVSAPTGQMSTTLADNGLSSTAAIEQRDRRMIAAVNHGQLIGLSDLLAEAHAAGALDAALTVENDIGTKNGFLAVVTLTDLEAALLAVVRHVVILQPALAGLIADRAVHRMIDQQELHHRFAHRQHLRALGQHRHAFRHLGVTGDLQLGHLFDLNQTHAAITRDRKLRVIAVSVGIATPTSAAALMTVVPLVVTTSLPSRMILLDPL